MDREQQRGVAMFTKVDAVPRQDYQFDASLRTEYRPWPAKTSAILASEAAR